jgi:GR25 family glycosyltransferase involved in LPS biosynthesis
MDEAFVINLDRREDRRKNFLEYHPYLKGAVRRLPAYDGRNIVLTPHLARLFKVNDFFWKKAVMGCALSHLKLWIMLANEPVDIKSYFILEDDARLVPGWQMAWQKAYPNVPNDWDVIYLGGVLPPNKPGFASCMERVAPGVAKVAPNSMFGQKEPTQYFHFCTYAYVLSRTGANKLLQSILDKDGWWTSADHMMCNRNDILNIYVLDPLLAGASQDDDPFYQSAEFNNFSRVDNFDSDLWNNDERFSSDEVSTQLSKNAHLNISAAINEIVYKTNIDKGVVANAPVQNSSTNPTFITLDVCKLPLTDLYESKWLQELFQSVPLTIKAVGLNDNLKDYDNIIVVLIRPKWQEQLEWLEKLRTYTTFKILHLSDEFGNDPIHMYNWPEVKGVLRFYNRADLVNDPKVLVLPLGYHWEPPVSLPKIADRKYTWSFTGTNWKNRSTDLEPLNAIKPNLVRWFGEWNDPAQLKKHEYLELMLDTQFIPCPRGMNVETYRFYEAIECGCIPIFVQFPETELWLKQFNNEIVFLNLRTWDEAVKLIQHFKNNPDQLEHYHTTVLLPAWTKFKYTLKERVKQWFKA